ncbi:hypothetical protein LAZ40_09340 [Cereibacter sphaeroides]|uniref:hypothetical protein n=1 Tax=Cereibacter sphaeroides TaxID=1063 RepID=UPI001F2F0BF2|nr:hypothetical protein [Cereibacter sphaeroides]MCE6959255.1 hypothetical protein [Cereibacter sphaeroides]MCE6971249.1 hypothetical protein [Cereibacter sphaeroides]
MPIEEGRDLRPWEKSLSGYLGAAPVSDGGLHASMLARARVDVRDRGDAVPAEDRHPHPVRDDLAYGGPRGSLLLFDRATGACLGGNGTWFPVAMEGTGGRNIGAELRWLQEWLGVQRGTTHFTISGFRAARSAHRLHVERALQRGDAVPDEVMDQYDWHDGRLRLRTPYEPEDHMAWAAAERLRITQARLDQVTAGYEERFLAAADLIGEPIPRAHRNAAFVAALAGETSLPLVLVRRGPVFAWLHIESGDLLVNVFGACRRDSLLVQPDEAMGESPSASATGGFVPILRNPEEPPESSRFANLEEFLEAASDGRTGLSTFEAHNLVHALTVDVGHYHDHPALHRARAALGLDAAEPDPESFS